MGPKVPGQVDVLLRVEERNKCIILVDPSEEKSKVLAGRLTSQGYTVEAFTDAAEAVNAAMAAPPVALIADLWMPGISGVQLCGLLNAEPATVTVPVILRAVGDDPRARFFAEKAGAHDYVAKGRIGQLVRAIARATEESPVVDGFFTQLSGSQIDIRDRLAEHLDRSMFAAMITAEVRTLSNAASLKRLFDLFSQFTAQILQYRWVSLLIDSADVLAIHTHPNGVRAAEAEARKLLDAPNAKLLLVVDDDARAAKRVSEFWCDVTFNGATMGRLGISAVDSQHDSDALLRLIGEELGGPIRMARLVEEAQRIACYDPLTSLMNRRAFEDKLSHLTDKHNTVGMLLLDIDHFKHINDEHGHATGDSVLVEVAAMLLSDLPVGVHPARWGGEEFVIAATDHDPEQLTALAELVRGKLEALRIPSCKGTIVPVTVSVGAAIVGAAENWESALDRADKAMYEAKEGGRNQVRLAS